MSETTWECWKHWRVSFCFDVFCWICFDGFKPGFMDSNLDSWIQTWIHGFKPGFHFSGSVIHRFQANVRPSLAGQGRAPAWQAVGQVARHTLLSELPSVFSLGFPMEKGIAEAAQNSTNMIHERFTQLDVELPSEKGLQADVFFFCSHSFPWFQWRQCPGISRLGPGMTTWRLGKVDRNREIPNRNEERLMKGTSDYIPTHILA